MKTLKIAALALCLNAPITHAIVDEMCLDNIHTAVEAGCCALLSAGLGYCEIRSLDRDIQYVDDMVQTAIAQTPNESGDEEIILSHINEQVRSDADIEASIRRVLPDRREQRRTMQKQFLALTAFCAMTCAYLSYQSFQCYFNDK